MSEQNGGSENVHLQRLDRMESVIQGMITLTREERVTNTQSHLEFMLSLKAMREDMLELLAIQREQRIDIMALFTANKDLRDTFSKYFDKGSER